jgi:hypothetical protein
MAMRMLEAGGAAILTDQLRTPDPDNPHGYFEFERVKQLQQENANLAWLAEARGKVVKIVSFLLTWLPDRYDYRVVFMERDLSELIASQQQMLKRRGVADERPDPAYTAAVYAQHLEGVRCFLANRSCFETLFVEHRDVLRDPLPAARRIATFVGGRLDVVRMASAVDRDLYRNRCSES